MKERFRICPYKDSESKVIIHPKNATKLGLNDKEGFLHFGIKELNIMIEEPKTLYLFQKIVLKR